jgi:flagellar biosynthesis protein FlhB
MAEHRPWAPSARRLGLAQRAGLTAASPQVVAAAAWGAAAIALAMTARAAAAQLGGWIAAACDGHATLAADGVPGAVTSVALPALVAVAVAAVAAQLAQTRTPWLPRRDVPGAPVVERARVAVAAREIGCAVALGAVAFGWLWTMAPRLAVADSLPAAAALIGSFVAALAVTRVAIGVVDALARHAEVAGALRMTDAERREDARLAAADPRWRARRAAAAKPTTSEAVAGAAVLLLGDAAAVAIAWDARDRPVPARVAVGRDARATQLLGLARRHRIAVHRDAALCAALVDEVGPVPEADWARLAEIIAAVQRPAATA